MTNTCFLGFTLLISLTVICYALMVQYWNRNMIDTVITDKMGSETILYYGNKSYSYFICKRIKFLKILVVGLILLLSLGFLNSEYLNKSTPIYNQDLMTLFSVLWMGLFLLLKFEFVMISKYKRKVYFQGECAEVEGIFRFVRRFYGFINRLINTMALSCLSLLIVIVI